MSDRELLELAAKAARYELSECPSGQLLSHSGKLFMNGKPWNPLTSEADRYRLAKDCQLMLHFDAEMARAYINDEPRDFWFAEHGEASAIVQAAAAIGRNMP